MAETPGNPADWQARLDALQASSAERHDPVRFAYLVALSRRAATAAEPVRQLLIAKTAALSDELAAHPTPARADSPESAADYLQAFMSYIDALIWLDHADPSRPTSSRPSGGEGEKKRKPKKV
ncbi:MAG: DUF2894 domain-containing protein [Dechloromonas sp.]|uniref:DUF2894 domain-containing protein n=1 Tax=Candidatus Dechloromonas phosphorivorans TaxID=2899244 RepID=A0A935K340_9RHOO|nr:DUF2894 domain-containing protein [Candidatus Dechloromonas phosphorivorans]